MPVNIGPRIGIEGEDEYRKQITNLVQSTKTLDAQMKALETTSDKEATAQEKAAKAAELLSKKQEEQQKRVDKLREMVSKSAEATGENSTKTLKWKEALANAEAELNKTGKELEDAQKAAEGYGTEAEQAAEQTSKVDEAAKLLAADKLADFFNKAGEAAAKLAGAAYDAAKELDEGYDTIIKKTGASGDQLAELQGIADDVFGSMPVEMSDVGTAVGELNTRFKLTGDELKNTSKTFLQFSKITDTDVNSAVASTSKILKAYGKDVKDADALLGYLAKQSQDTGIETGQLMSSLEQNGATLREMGIGLQESVKLLASFEENGVDASAAMTGLRKAIVNGAKEGKSANTVLTETISRIKNAKSDTEALQIATEVFGTRGAAVMADGIRTGRIALDNLSESMDQYGNVVADTFEATLDPWDQAKIAMNNLKTAGSNLAGEALAVLAPAIEKVVGWIQQATEWFKGLPAPVQKVVATIGALGAGAAVVGPKILSVVNTIKSLQASAKILKGNTDGATSSMTSMSSSAGNLGKSLGMVGGIVAGAIAAIEAIDEAVKNWRLENDEAYRSAMKIVDAMDEVKNAASDYGDYLDRTRRELKAESEMEMSAADRAKSAAQKLQSVREKQAEADKNRIIAKQQLIDMLGSEEKAEEALRLGQFKSGAMSEDLIHHYDGIFGSLTKDVDAYNATVAAIQEYDATVEDSDALIGELTAVLEENGYTFEEASALAEEYGSTITETADEVEDGFDAILKAAKDDLSKSITYLDQWADQGGASLEDMASQMQQNAKDMASWKQNVLTITSDARYGMDRNYTAAVDMLIAQGGKGATAVAQFAEAMRTGNAKAVNAFLTGYNGISTQSTQIENRIGTLQANAKAKLDGLKPAAEQGVAGMATGMSNSKALVEKAAKAVAEAQEYAKISTDKAKSWGADAIAALAKGMQSERWQVRKQADILAQDVKDRLGHSTPKLGPLHGDDKWGYHMADNIAKGLAANSSLNKIQSAAMSAAYAAMPAVQMPTGNTTNHSLTYGDIVVNVSGANIQNEQALAKAVSDQIFKRVKAQKAVWA